MPSGHGIAKRVNSQDTAKGEILCFCLSFRELSVAEASERLLEGVRIINKFPHVLVLGTRATSGFSGH